MACRWGLIALVALAAGCDAEGGGAAGIPDAGPAADVPAATPWTPGATTTKTPVYGACRYAAGQVIAAASNGAPDDAVRLEGPAAGPLALAVTVRDGAGPVLDAAVTVQRGLPGKSFDSAAGTASVRVGAMQEMTVLDGALCFDGRLGEAAAPAGELTLVLEDAGGALWSVAGRFTLPAAAVASAAPLDVDAPGLDVDLR